MGGGIEMLLLACQENTLANFKSKDYKGRHHLHVLLACAG